jgi:uncharacterized caspase-like protein
MKKGLILVAMLAGVLALCASSAWAQQKYALVIGNAAYRQVTGLRNSVNDARDMSAALKSLGFTVDTVLNGSLGDMENAVMRLQSKLQTSKNAYGFFYYAGHGVQANGANYLIPVDASVPNAAALRYHTLNMQEVLDELNSAGNALNIVVLDACRDNPFKWSRGAGRGLVLEARQPANSIIVYAAGAGEAAADGTGHNGLFTGDLLKNMKKVRSKMEEEEARSVEKAASTLRRLFCE